MDKHHYADYLSRAQQHLDIAQIAFEQGKYDACANNAIQSAISASDALTTFFKQERSAGQSHDMTVRLFKETNPQDSETQSKANIFSRIIGEKNVSAYEEKPVKPRVAEVLLKEAEQLLAFVKKKIFS